MMFLQVIILLAGFLFLVKGADWFVEGAASIAKKLGIPQLIIGLTIVAMGTSMPEAAVSITAAINKNAGITIGNEGLLGRIAGYPPAIRLLFLKVRKIH